MQMVFIQNRSSEKVKHSKLKQLPSYEDGSLIQICFTKRIKNARTQVKK